MTKINGIAAIAIVLIGGASALYRLDTDQGNRSAIAAALQRGPLRIKAPLQIVQRSIGAARLPNLRHGIAESAKTTEKDKMTEKNSDEIDIDAQMDTTKQPPVAGTVAGRVSVQAIPSNDDPASPGADADRLQSED